MSIYIVRAFIGMREKRLAEIDKGRNGGFDARRTCATP